MPGPDENTAVDPTGAAWVVWLVIVAPGLLFVTLTCVRRVGTGEMVLILRHGKVVRSRRAGVATRWPGVERLDHVSIEPQVVPLVIRSRTCDGVDVVALADLTVQVRDVEIGTLSVPTSDLVRIAEDSVGTEVRRLEVRSLVNDLDALQDRWRRQITRQLPTGTTALGLAVTEVEVQLTPRVVDVISDEREDGASC